jgi:hypothetical protein
MTIAKALYDDRTEGSVAVMLVLDCTSSLDEFGARGSLHMKDAAYNFVNILLSGELGNAGAETGIGAVSSAALLTNGLWKDGEFTNDGMDYYKVSVTVGIPYYFWWNDKDNVPVFNEPGKTADVQVSFSSDGGDTWSNWVDSAWLLNEGYNYPVYRSGTLYIRVRPFDASTGTYAITYRAYANTRPHH